MILIRSNDVKILCAKKNLFSQDITITVGKVWILLLLCL